MRDAAAFQHGQALRPAVLQELRAQARLASAGFRHDPQNLPAVPGPLQRCLQQRHVAIAPDEGGQAAGARTVQARSERAGSFQIEHGHRLGHALDLDAAPVAQLEIACDQPRRLLGEADVPGFGERFHAPRDADIVAERGIVHREVVADPADHHLARVEADADVELDGVPRTHALREGTHRVADVQGREAGWLGVIFMRYRRTEQRHDVIAGELVDRALEPMHAGGGDLEEILDDAKPLSGIEPFGEVHRALDIGEQDGDVLALAFQRRPRLADLVGEVFGRQRRARTRGKVVRCRALNRCRHRPRSAERGDGIEQLAPVADCGNPDLPEIFRCQPRQHLPIDLVVVEARGIALKTQTLQPLRNVHA